MEMEDRLPCGRADIDDHTVIRQALARGYVRDELEHPLRLVGRELADVAERVDVPLRDDEQVGLGACGLMSRIATKPSTAATWSPSR